jgi:pyrroloquinoline-quinone synthase
MSESVWKRIEEIRAQNNVLEHPFYVRWSAGELSPDELARYSGQYRHATEALAKLCADAAELAPEAHRDEIERHAAEEQDHIGLWDDFVEAAGGEIGAEPTAETAECVREWTASRGYLSALARLYAIESGQPEISRIKREGLSRFYGIDGGPGSEYFRVHESSDDAHAAESKRLIERAMEAGDEDAVVAAAESAFQANLRLLDGVS